MKKWNVESCSLIYQRLDLPKRQLGFQQQNYISISSKWLNFNKGRNKSWIDKQNKKFSRQWPQYRWQKIKKQQHKVQVIKRRRRKRKRTKDWMHSWMMLKKWRHLIKLKMMKFDYSRKRWFTLYSNLKDKNWELNQNT